MYISSLESTIKEESCLHENWKENNRTQHFLCRDQRHRRGREDRAGTEDGAGSLLLGEMGGMGEVAGILGASPSGAIQPLTLVVTGMSSSVSYFTLIFLSLKV